MRKIKELPRKTIEVNGANVSFIESGSGPVLFLMHGIGGNSRSWTKQFEGLTSKYRIIAWDAPGYGDSELRKSNLADYVAAAEGLLAALGVERVNVLGHSMGGVIAQGLAGLGTIELDKLILSSTFMGHGESKGEPLQAGYLARLNDIAKLSPEEFGQARAKTMLAKPTSDEIFQEVANIASAVRKPGLLAACEVLNYSDTSQILKNFSKPVLVVTGRHDKIVTPDRSIDMTAHIANSQHIQFLNSGHAAYLEEPLAYNDALSRFLS